MFKRFVLVILGFLLLSFSVMAAQTPPPIPGPAGRNFVNLDPLISSTDGPALNGATLYHDAQTGDYNVCTSADPDLFCLFATTGTTNASTAVSAVGTLPLWIKAANTATASLNQSGATITLTSLPAGVAIGDTVVDITTPASSPTHSSVKSISGNVVTLEFAIGSITSGDLVGFGTGVSGTNIPTFTLVSTYTGTPGGSGAIVLTQSATGSTSGGTLNFFQPGNVIQFPASGSITDTVTTSGTSSVSLTLTTNAVCTNALVGELISLSGLGANGATLFAHVLQCNSTKEPFLDTPVQANCTSGCSGVTINYGFAALMQANPAIGWAGLSAGAQTNNPVSFLLNDSVFSSTTTGGVQTVPTIINVYSANYIAASSTNNNVTDQSINQHFVTGHDDSVAISTACNYALTNNIALVWVDFPIFAPNFSQACYQLNYFTGDATGIPEGRIVISDGTNGNALTEPAVITRNAPHPTPPRRSLVASRDLPNLAAHAPSGVCMFGMDSLGESEPNGLNDLYTYPGSWTWHLNDANRGRFNCTPVYISAPGSVLSDYTAAPTGGTPPCTTTANLLSIPQIVSNGCEGQSLDMGFGTNDEAGLSFYVLFDAYTRTRYDMRSEYASGKDVTFTTHHPKSNIATQSGSTPTDQYLYAAVGIDSFAELMGSPILDGSGESFKHARGWDPHGFLLQRSYDAPVQTNLGATWNYNRLVYGFAFTQYYFGKYGSTYWTPWSSYGDTRFSGVHVFPLSLPTNNTVANWLYLGLCGSLAPNGANGDYCIEADFNSGLPGTALLAANGKPPVFPLNSLAPVTVANSGAGGVAVVSLETASFTASCSGTAMTVSSVTGTITTGPMTIAGTTLSEAALSGTGITPGTYMVSGSGTSYVVSSACTSSSNTVAQQAGTFVYNGAAVSSSNCPTGQTIAISGAGVVISSSFGGGTYTAPDIDTIASCQSNTQITLTHAATTTFSKIPGIVFLGNPVIDTGVADVGNGSDAEVYHVEMSGDDRLLIWGNLQTQTLYNGPIGRGGGRYVPRIWGGGSGSGSGIEIGTIDSGSGIGTSWQIAVPLFVHPDLTDTLMVGPADQAPVNNQSYSGQYGADGLAHDTQYHGVQTLEPLYNAQDWYLGLLAAPVVTTSAYTVANCGIGLVPVNDAGAVTITLPTYCPARTTIVVQDEGGNAGSDTITIAAPANGNLTLSGSTTITTAHGYRTVVYGSQTTATSQ
jgi:hypothetical protein